MLLIKQWIISFWDSIKSEAIFLEHRNWHVALLVGAKVWLVGHAFGLVGFCSDKHGFVISFSCCPRVDSTPPSINIDPYIRYHYLSQKNRKQSFESSRFAGDQIGFEIKARTKNSPNSKWKLFWEKAMLFVFPGFVFLVYTYVYTLLNSGEMR